MSARRAHRIATRLLSTLMAVIGLALVVEVVGAGGSAVSARLLLGVLFVAGGLGRLYVEARRQRGS
jgi:hypothetical protein